MMQMDEITHAIVWEAPEHMHTQKGSDWFWVLWIIAICAAMAVFFLGNFLFAIVILVGAASMALLAAREPAIIEYAVTTRGVRIGDRLYPYSTLDSFFLDEENPLGTQLLLKSKRLFMPLIVMPIPEEYIHDIDDLLLERLEEEELVEPLAHKLLEFFGF